MTLIFTSCDSQINNIEIDKISDIDIFENYEDNVKLSKDIVNQNWNEFYSSEIVGFIPTDTKDLKFFTNTRPQENKLIIQFRYPKFDKPNNLDKVRELTIKKIEEIKTLQKKNENLILSSTKKVESLIKLLNEKNYPEFYKHFYSKAAEQLSYEKFIIFINQMKDRGFKDEERDYLNKSLIKFDDYTEGMTDIIEYHYWQKNNHSKYESFNFQNIDGKMEFIGYKAQ